MAGATAGAQGGFVMRFMLAAGAALIGLGAPMAWAEGMADAFGNTVTATYDDGSVIAFHFEPDGTFTMIDRDGTSFAADWTLDGEEIFFIARSGERTCEPFPAGKGLGDTWRYVSADGVEVTLAVTPGR
jgi:hypothetical protein